MSCMSDATCPSHTVMAISGVEQLLSIEAAALQPGDGRTGAKDSGHGVEGRGGMVGHLLNIKYLQDMNGAKNNFETAVKRIAEEINADQKEQNENNAG